MLGVNTIADKVVFPLFAISSLLSADFQNHGLVLIDGLQEVRQNVLAFDESASWHKELKEAFQDAEKSRKNVLVILMGGKNCPWSEKFLQEVLSQKAFLDPLEKEVIFYKCDYACFKDKKEDLKLSEEVKEFPSLILFSPEGKEISRSGYLPYEPAIFAKRISSIIRGYNELTGKLIREESKELNDPDLECMYQEAKEIGCISLKKHLLDLGAQRKKNVFFLIERYSQLLSEGKKKNSEAKALKASILSLDPKNRRGSIRKLAVLDFEDSCKNKKKSHNPFAVIKPLVEYVKNYGEEDRENSWKIEMMIAEYLYSKNKVSAALHHAEASYKKAPESAKFEIQESLDYLRVQAAKLSGSNQSFAKK